MPSIHATVTQEVQAGWRRFAAENGVTVASLIAALGQELAELDDGALQNFRSEWVQAARDRDAANRKH